MSIADTTRGRLIALVQTVDDQREAIETFKANRAEAKAQLETVIAEIRSTIKDPEAEPRETMGKLAKLERQRIRRQLELVTLKANKTAAKGEGQLADSQILVILRDLRDGGDPFEQPGEQIDRETGEVVATHATVLVTDGTSYTIDKRTGKAETLTPEKAEQAAQIPLSPTDASVAAIGAVVGVGPDDGRDAPSSTWDSRLTVSCGVANPKKVNAQTAEHLRTAGYPTLNEVEAFRREHWDKGWRDAFREEVKIGSGYLLTDRNLDGLEESIKTRLGQ
jgi:hypothetical protein